MDGGVVKRVEGRAGRNLLVKGRGEGGGGEQGLVCTSAAGRGKEREVSERGNREGREEGLEQSDWKKEEREERGGGRVREGEWCVAH